MYIYLIIKIQKSNVTKKHEFFLMQNLCDIVTLDFSYSISSTS